MQHCRLLGGSKRLFNVRQQLKAIVSSWSSNSHLVSCDAEEGTLTFVRFGLPSLIGTNALTYLPFDPEWRLTGCLIVHGLELIPYNRAESLERAVCIVYLHKSLVLAGSLWRIRRHVNVV